MISSSQSDSVQEVYVGAHRFVWTPPDLFALYYDGDVDLPTSLALSTQGRVFTLGQPCVFLLVDMTRVGKVSVDARRASAQGGKGLNLRGVAVIGASAPLRIISSLVSRAIDLLNRNIDNPTRFFETEGEARAWIALRREALKKR